MDRVTVAVTMAICWLIVFLSGPLNQRWYKEWQETAFVFMSLLIVLFGSKSEDRQERENFLNTFGKHLKAARVQERLANMRKAMDESIAPQTALGSIIKKLLAGFQTTFWDFGHVQNLFVSPCRFPNDMLGFWTCTKPLC